MIQRVIDLAHELAGTHWHNRPQQASRWGVVRAFLGIPCEFGSDCAYPGIGWRCGHRRRW